MIAGALVVLGAVFVQCGTPDARAAGTPFAWGDSTQTNSALIPTLTNTVAIAAGPYHNLALLDNGTVAAWGINSAGQASIPPGLANVKAVGAGDYHSLAVRSNGTVVAWGDNSGGQTNVPAGLSGVTQVAGGQYHSLALSGGRVFAWGANGSGQTTVPSLALSGVVAIAAGGNHSLALRNNATVVAWGNNYYGESTVPGGLSGIIAIAAGPDYSLALRSDGAIFAWGHPPANIFSLSVPGAISIAAGGDHALALRNNSTVYAWGANTYNQATVPAGLTNVIAIAAGDTHSLVLRMDPPRITAQPQNQSVFLGSPATFTVSATGSSPLSFRWRKGGANISGATSSSYTIGSAQTNDAGTYSVVLSNAAGVVTSTNATLTVKVLPFLTEQPQSQSVAVGSTVWFQVTAGGSLPLSYQWRKNGTNLPFGFNSTYSISGAQLSHAGNYTVVVTNAYGAVTSAVAVLSVFELPAFMVQPLSQTALAGSSVTLTVDATNATSYQWRKDDTDIPGATSPMFPINSAQASQAGAYTAVASNLYGSATSSVATLTVTTPAGPSSTVVELWGEDPVWTGSDLVALTPPAGLIDAGAVAAGAYHCLALRSDGTVVGWGDNTFAQAGPPANLANVAAIAAGAYHSLARLSNGTVVAWGTYDPYQTNVPPTLANVTAIAAGGQHNLALLANGTVAGWGINTDGQITMPANLTNAVAIAAGKYHSLALRANSTVAGWGNNAYGQRLIPTGLTNVIAVAAGAYHSLALRSNGTVTAWGQNLNGETSVPATLSNVVAIAAGSGYSLALLRNGTVVGWGQNNFNQTVPPEGLAGLIDLEASGAHSLALRKKLLALWPPQRQANGRSRLLIGNADGSPIGSARIPGVELYATTNLGLPLSNWTRLTTPFSITNGLLLNQDLSTNLPRRFYMTVERP